MYQLFATLDFFLNQDKHLKYTFSIISWHYIFTCTIFQMESIVGKFGLVVITRAGSDPYKFIYESDLLYKYQVSVEQMKSSFCFDSWRSCSYSCIQYYISKGGVNELRRGTSIFSWVNIGSWIFITLFHIYVNCLLVWSADLWMSYCHLCDMTLNFRLL